MPSRVMGRYTFLSPRRIYCILVAFFMVVAMRRACTGMDAEAEPVFFEQAMMRRKRVAANTAISRGRGGNGRP